MSGILVVSPDNDQCKALAESISSRGRHVQTAGSIRDALHLLAQHGHEQILSVRNLPTAAVNSWRSRRPKSRPGQG